MADQDKNEPDLSWLGQGDSVPAPSSQKADGKKIAGGAVPIEPSNTKPRAAAPSRPSPVMLASICGGALVLVLLFHGLVNHQSQTAVTTRPTAAIRNAPGMPPFRSAPAATFSGQVVGVADGDTISVMHNGRLEKIRLSGIDCPEMGQAFGKDAKEYAASLCLNKVVSAKTFGQDRYGRTIGDIRLPDGRVLNRELVKAGWAWWYRQYARNDSVLEKLERDARNSHSGLWSDPYPMPPWQFRQREKHR